MRELNPRQLTFVKHYTSGLHSAAEAARMSGYAPAHARRASQYILSQQKIKQAIAEARTAIGAATVYDGVAASKELDTVIAFARETKNATAMTRAIEIRLKLHGLLIERVQMTTIDIAGALAEARARAAQTYTPEGRLVED